ncbi:MAG TPA: dienelactone hydrolase family protein [Candidatus Limnocylindrales bacterium]|nr:dienelactone hydrolase family protein [Candidatus Limnocylindrales bacterium]
MCFDLDSHPPIRPIAGGALDAGHLTLTSADGTAFNAFRARAATPTGAGMIVLPDVRGLFPFYEELALRFAEQGIDAVAIDYFGRTAGTDPRPPDFEYMPHVNRTTFAGLSADIAAAAAYLRSSDGGAVADLFTVGFCFGGRLSFDAATIGLGLAGVIGFYGPPTGPGRNDAPAPADVADRCGCPVLGLFGGVDPGIPSESVAVFDAALARAGVEHRIVTYDGAPHSFFDRKAADFAAASDAAWSEVLSFVRGHTRAAA